MTKKNNGRKTDRKSVRLIIPGWIETTADRSQYRPDYKRVIERFFRLQSFPPKATKKPPIAQSKSVLRLSDLNAIVEAMRRRVDDQRREHKRTLRKSANRK